MRSAEEGSPTDICQTKPGEPFVVEVSHKEKPAQNRKSQEIYRKVETLVQPYGPDSRRNPLNTQCP